MIVFGCKHTSCKRYYNLPFVAADADAVQHKSFTKMREHMFLDVNALAI